MHSVGLVRIMATEYLRVPRSTYAYSKCRDDKPENFFETTDTQTTKPCLVYRRPNAGREVPWCCPSVPVPCASRASGCSAGCSSHPRTSLPLRTSWRTSGEGRSPLRSFVVWKHKGLRSEVRTSTDQVM